MSTSRIFPRTRINIFPNSNVHNKIVLTHNLQVVLKCLLVTILSVGMLHTIFFQVRNNGSKEVFIFTKQGSSSELVQETPNTTEQHYTESPELHTIERVCSKLTQEKTLHSLNHFLVDHNHKLLYCWIHKSASTSWIALFSHLANRSNIRKYYREIPVLSVRNMEELNEISNDSSYHKFMVVRHPFARLVSAYRDRFEDNSRFTSQAYIYAPSILRRTRPSLDIPRSEMFLNGRKDRLLIVPTFEEFIRWLIATKSDYYDVHWNRYTDHCSPCIIKYDTIIKLENFEDTKQNFMKKIRVDIKHLQQSKGGPTTFQTSCKYFSQLDPDQIQSVYHIYKHDFEIFGYSVDDYRKCVKQ